MLRQLNLEIKINHLEKIKIDIENFIKRSLRIHKSNKLISKTQQIFTSERHNAFT